MLGFAPRCDLLGKLRQHIDCAENVFSNFERGNKFTRLCRGDFMRGNIAKKPVCVKYVGLCF